jgi:hypothetical protein
MSADPVAFDQTDEVQTLPAIEVVIQVQPLPIDPLSLIDPPTINIAWNTERDIIWILEGNPDARFVDGGIVFARQDAPFERVTLGDTVCVFHATNDDPALVGPFQYTITVSEGFEPPFTIDPTVENDPPPVEG